MDERLGWEQETRHGRRLGRRVLAFYLSTGAALAVSRVALFAWLDHRQVSHTLTETVWYFSWGLYPEALVAAYSPLGVMNLNWTKFFLVFGSLLTVGSFVLATPILLVGWLVRRRRQNLVRS